MLLTITYKGENAADLGFLLFKNPRRPQVFELSYGKAYVFYPEIGDTVCTAAMLLDIDPIDLARGKVGSKEGSKEGGLFDYVNDRPYVSSSFMSAAIARVFGTAMTGRCDQKPELAEQAIDLTAVVSALPCKGDMEMLNRVFVPLGYDVSFETSILDERHPEWGGGKYADLTVSGKVRLQTLLRHLYVLIPVFDRQKHYWIGRDEVDKLLRHGEGWLKDHPEKDFITARYMGGRHSLTRMAMDKLVEDGQTGALTQEAPSDDAEITPKPPNLNTRRLTAVVQALKNAGAASVIDMGCGEGRLLFLLLKERDFSRIAGTDVSWQALERARQRLGLERLPDMQKSRVALFQGSLTYKDGRFRGYDAACVVEVIEHMDLNRLPAFEQVLFGEARPGTVILTTPNAEYNERYEFLYEGSLRHRDHRFEWTRRQFEDWARGVAGQYGYTVAFSPIGDEAETHGAPTQMGVFTLCE